MGQLAVSKQTIDTTKNAIHPYPPSWVDRLTDWIERLPGPTWLFYLGIDLALVIIRTIAAWSDGSLPVGTFFPAHVYVTSSGVFLLFLLHYLDDRAGAALSDFRQVLNVGPEETRDAGYERLRYQLTTMPARPVLAWTFIGLVLGIGSASGVLVREATLQGFKLFTSPTTSVMDYIGIPLSFLLIPVVMYHTIRQLRLVSRIYTQHTNVNIFESGPLYALSRVTAITAVALLFVSYVTFAVTSGGQVTNVATVPFALFAALVLLVPATFVWPLLGAHTLLQESKARRKSEVARQMELVTDDLHRRTSVRDYSDMANMNDAIDSLIKEQGALDKISTWPWAPETVRAVATALLLPVALWIITRVLERLGF